MTKYFWDTAAQKGDETQRSQRMNVGLCYVRSFYRLQANRESAVSPHF